MKRSLRKILLLGHEHDYSINPKHEKELKNRLVAIDGGAVKTKPYKKSLNTIRKQIKSG